MAFILVPNKLDSKGVMIFKHLEIQYISVMEPKLLLSLKSLYHIGVYFGFHYSLKKDIAWADFYLAADNVLNIPYSQVPRIALNGFNFINADEISSGNIASKKYDFLFIGNSQTRKNLYKFVLALKELSDNNISYTSLIVNRLGESIEEKFYVKRIRKVLRMLSSDNRKNITYLESMTSSNGLPKDVMKKFYEQSRCLVITSRSEGAARVVGEASLNDLAVISYSNMKGGTNNHLNLEVDKLFNSFDELPTALESIVSNRYSLKDYVAPNKNCYLESHNKKILILRLAELLSYDIEFLHNELKGKNLYNAFSSHLNLIGSQFSNNTTDEILSYSKMHNFILDITESETKSSKLFICRLRDCLDGVKTLLNIPKTFIKLLVY